LANAHVDAAAAAGGLPVLQIGMDTPQVTAELIGECGRELLAADAVLGPARDGGWWVLGVTDAAMADCLRAIPMSRSDTGAATLAALGDTGANVSLVPTLADVDTIADIDDVRRVCAPDSRFVLATRQVSRAR
jgi:glycosyltransferase A (GT-A) superfamily protein (DUF2064 family)